LAKLGIHRRYGYFEDCKKTLSQEEFIALLTNTFRFANLSKYSKTLLPLIYKKISQKGKLTYGEYLYGWVKKYICQSEVTYDEYYVKEDDEDICSETLDDDEIRPAPIPDCYPIIFKFTDYSFGKLVRQKVSALLRGYDLDGNGRYSDSEMKCALINLLG
jgi:hypothetical protein